MSALLLAVLAAAVQTSDSTPPKHPDPDRIFIDAAGIIRQGAVQSLADVLTSRVPGLLVILGSGLNGGGSRIRFAGPRAIVGDGAPLILVDGIRVDAAADGSTFDLGGPGPLRLDDFNLEDIESIEVVSNPAAAMIHGPGAANGAILIRTKRGRSGSPQLTSHAQAWLETVTTRWPANYGGVDADNPNASLRSSCALSFQAAGNCAQDYVQSFNPLTDRSPFGTAVRHHAGVSATGGPEWGAFRLAGGIDGAGGVYDVPLRANPDGFSRWNITTSGTLRPHRFVDVGFKLTRISSDLHLPTYGPISSALYGSSDSSGFSWTPMFAGVPRERLDRTFGIAEGQVRPLRWLTGRVLLGVDDVEQRGALVSPGFSRTETSRDFKNSTTALSLSAIVPASRSVRFHTTIGWERAKRRRHELARVGSDTGAFCQTSCSFVEINLPRRWVAAYITEDITIRERLAVTAALRYDKFVVFGNKQRQYNPLLRVSWIARSRQPGLVSGLRFHASYGSASGTGVPDGAAFIVVPIGTSLPKLRPERVTSAQTGIDAQLLDGRWDARVTLYDLRSDVMQQVTLSPSAGAFPQVFASGSKVDNRGIVATVGGPVLARGDVRWDVQLSVWGNRNRLRSVQGAPALYGNGQAFLPDYPTGGYWANRLTHFADANGDGIIESSELVLDPQRSWAGTPYPTQGAGLQSSWRLGARVRVAVALDYRAGHVLFNQAAYARCQLANVCRDRHDPATPLDRQAVAVGRPATGIPLQYYEDADYLKLRELQVSFDLPVTTAERLGAREATISLAARNLLTSTRYSGGDPEAGSYGTATPDTPMTIADFGIVPVARSLALQVRVSY